MEENQATKRTETWLYLGIGYDTKDKPGWYYARIETNQDKPWFQDGIHKIRSFSKKLYPAEPGSILQVEVTDREDKGVTVDLDSIKYQEAHPDYEYRVSLVARTRARWNEHQQRKRDEKMAGEDPLQETLDILNKAYSRLPNRNLRQQFLAFCMERITAEK